MWVHCTRKYRVKIFSKKASTLPLMFPSLSLLPIYPRPADLWHNFPQTMKKMNSATWMMSGNDYLENGEVISTFTKYNLKEMQVRA